MFVTELTVDPVSHAFLTENGCERYFKYNKDLPVSYTHLVSMQANSIIMALAGAERIFKMMDEESDTDENRKAIMKLVNQIRRRAAGSGYEIPEEQFLNREEYDQEGIRRCV